MTTRLYDRRVAAYPVLFAATGAFRKSRLSTAQDLRRHLIDAIGHVGQSHAAEGGLILSACEQLLELRLAVRRYLDEPAGSEQLDQLQHHGEMRLPGARIGGRLYFDGAQLSDAGGRAN